MLSAHSELVMLTIHSESMLSAHSELVMVTIHSESMLSAHSELVMLTICCRDGGLNLDSMPLAGSFIPH